MRRKKIVAILFLISLALPASAQLTKDDVVRIIRAELEPIKQGINALKVDVAEMKGKMVSKEWFLTMWITIFLAILGVPYLWQVRSSPLLTPKNTRLDTDPNLSVR